MSHIYFLDATVFSLEVEQRILRDAEGDTDYAVTIDLMGLPSLIVRRNEPAQHAEGHDNYCCTKLDYNAGRACHFTADRSSLVNALKRNPLRIGIYRVGDRFPVCHGVVPFSGCVCDMISRSIETPSPFEFGGTFNLIDPGHNPAGHVILRLVLTDLGRHVVTFYALDVAGFVTKNYLDGAEYRCVRSKNSNDCDEENSPSRNDRCSTELILENVMRDIAGISLGARSLSLGKAQPKRAHEALEVPVSVSDGSKSNAGKANGDKTSKKKSNKKTKGR